ncbi:glycerol-3-phosphate dehydrogenase [Pokkaliibacter sp. CJK22405]|uniref:glycerol-3-phosphate dehydrogenase n=1 Tax=Pokkaliibacter sp. CJK22405 TaxID=3384615 RepID=UPI0039855914
MDGLQRPETSPLFDLFVVGGGINGVGIANDAAGRGLKVLLCEQRDLASATSSSSSKLIHGGLRYLEYYEFRLVKEALREREVLLKKAPHIIWPLRFRLPHRPFLRPAWLIRLGLFLYDHLSSRRSLPATAMLSADTCPELQPEFQKLFEYSDCWVDDARLVVLNAMQARQFGAEILTHHRCVSAHRTDDCWQITLEDADGMRRHARAKGIVNAAGPWVTELFSTGLDVDTDKKIRLVQGSHIVVPKLHEGKHAYILQNEDKRIVFVIPYQQDYSLVGTTDLDFQGDPHRAHITDSEVDYLLGVINGHFRQQTMTSDIKWSYAGVRPLLDNDAGSASAVTRDYTLDLNAPEQKLPLVSVFGGKITTYRKLSEACVNKLAPFYEQMTAPWTANAALPGGNFSTPEALSTTLELHFPWLPASLRQRYVTTYGTLSFELLQDCNSLKDLGEHFGAGLYVAEVNYLMKYEWAMNSEDILWRRTKLGLELSLKQRESLEYFMQQAQKLSEWLSLNDVQQFAS